jgi:hypothetical protein
MAIIFFPNSHQPIRSDDAVQDLYPRRADFLSPQDDLLEDGRWPPGWWILPFGVCGFIPWLFAIEWLVSWL